MFAEKLKDLRKSRQLKQADLAKAVGVSPSAIGMYEQGRRIPDHKTLLEICRYFSVSTDYFLKDDVDLSPQGQEQGQEQEISDFLRHIRHLLLSPSQPKMTYQGIPLGREELLRIADALEVGAAVALSQCKRISADREGK